MSAVLDFNPRVLREAHASDAINGVIYEALQKKQKAQDRRQYLGASAIGGSCERRLQFDYAGTPKESGFADLTLIKFDLGHMNEELSRCHFQDAGFKLVTSNQRTGQPFRFTQMDGRFAGTPDGVFIDGPDVLQYPCLWETKSVGSKTYKAIEKDGLRKARPTYYAQVAVYQAYLCLTDNPAVFTVFNLDTGERLHLLIPFDAEEAQRMTDRAVRIIQATEAGDLLPRPFAKSDHFECRWCPFAKRCWSMV